MAYTPIDAPNPEHVGLNAPPHTPVQLGHLACSPLGRAPNFSTAENVYGQRPRPPKNGPVPSRYQPSNIANSTCVLPPARDPHQYWQ